MSTMGAMRHLAFVAAFVTLAGCGASQDHLTDEQIRTGQELAPADAAENEAATHTAEAGPAAEPILYKAVGNEPGWSLTVHPSRIDYVGNYGEVRFSEPTPAGFRRGPGKFATRRLAVEITEGPCNDGMSDLRYRHTVRILADGADFGGCGGGTLPTNSLADTSWTVTAVNGRATGGESFYIRFAENRIDAKFGCNAIGGTFSQNGDHVSAEPLFQTEMDCRGPSAGFESDGAAVLGSNMRLEATSGTDARLVSEAGSIDLRRAI